MPPAREAAGNGRPGEAGGPDRLDGSRILVTGATGFIGGHVVELLHRLGGEVHAVHRGPDPRVSFDTPVQWHRADLTDPDATARAVASARPDHLVHLASLVKGARDPELLLPMFQANLASTVHLLEAARVNGVRRVLLAGSLEEPEAGKPATSPYALSKAASHLYGDYYRAAAGIEVINLQIFMVYGPATPDETKLVPYVTRQLLAGEVPELSSGVRLVDWVYVGDVAEGVARGIAVEVAPADPVPLGTGHLHAVREVVEILARVSGSGIEPRFGSVADRSDEVVRAADVDLTRTQLGWAPDTDLVSGLERTFDWYRAKVGSALAGASRSEVAR